MHPNTTHLSLFPYLTSTAAFSPQKQDKQTNKKSFHGWGRHWDKPTQSPRSGLNNNWVSLLILLHLRYQGLLCSFAGSEPALLLVVADKGWADSPLFMLLMLALSNPYCQDQLFHYHLHGSGSPTLPRQGLGPAHPKATSSKGLPFSGRKNAIGSKWYRVGERAEHFSLAQNTTQPKCVGTSSPELMLLENALLCCPSEDWG